MSVYYLGNDVDIDLTVKDDETLELQNAATITLTITLPDGTTVTPVVTNLSTGQYRVTYAPGVIGHFTYVWETTGPAGKVFGWFDVVDGQRNFSSLTLQDLIDQVISTLHGQTVEIEQATWLTADLTDSGTSLTVEDATQVSRGLVEIDEELLWVASTDEPTNTVTLAPFGRGYRDTDAVAHSTNAMVLDTPRFPRVAVKRVIQDTLLALYPDVFQVLTDVSNTVNPVVITYALPNNCDTIIDVSWQSIGPSQEWIPVRRWRLEPDTAESVFPTGKAISIFDGMIPGRTIKVTYVAPPGQLDEAASTLSETGLPDSIRDVLVYGACYRLLAGLEGARLQTTAIEQSERSQLVNSGAAANASQYFFGLYSQALTREVRRLQKFYPTRSHQVR